MIERLEAFSLVPKCAWKHIRYRADVRDGQCSGRTKRCSESPDESVAVIPVCWPVTTGFFNEEIHKLHMFAV